MEKTAVDDIIDSFRRSVGAYFEEEALFVLGVSGGPDSMALLYLFHILDLNVLVVHINYNKRGEASDKDQDLVEQMAFQWGFECCSIQLDSSTADIGNFQNWAREERYHFFKGLRDAHKAAAIVTAHHQDDQIETILQKVLRGSSPTAWQGMSSWDGNIFRPLLNFSKEEILHFCEVNAIPYRIDESNLQSSFARNFLRKEFSEQMDRFFPGWQQNILELQQQGGWFQQSIEWITAQISEDFVLDVHAFSELPQQLKPAILKHLLDDFNGDTSCSKAQLQELSKIEDLQTGKSLVVGNAEFIRDRDRVILQKKKEDKAWKQPITRQHLEDKYTVGGVNIRLTKGIKSRTGLYIDAEALDWPLQIRHWKHGDRFIPFGMKGSQKISDHLTNRKIASNLKEKTLVLCGSDSTIYAIIYPGPVSESAKGAISELAKCDENTTTYLTIKPTK
ncbi:MAG: tRNA lysidine(34) synthetase TilS [Balneolaceae bacterium]|nr:tRNA lysidine(34) synthetase TilS [Balneolaceae bacterium]